MMIGPEVTTWEDWGSIYQQEKVWSPLIQKIMDKEGMVFETIRKGFPGTSAVFILDDRYVVKIYPSQFIDDHKREMPVLNLLEKLYDRTLLIASGKYTDVQVEWPYVILPYINGEAYRDIKEQLSLNEWRMFSRKLAHFLYRLHHLPLDDLKNASCYQWLPECPIEKQLQAIYELPFFHNPSFKNDLLSFIKAWLPELKKEPLSFVHGDLTVDHLMFSQDIDGWTFETVIDLGDAHIAPVYYDWTVLWIEVFSERSDDWQLFIKDYESNLNVTEERFRYLLVTALFLHPFALHLIEFLYKTNSKDQIGESFESVSDFMRFIKLP